MDSACELVAGMRLPCREGPQYTWVSAHRIEAQL